MIMADYKKYNTDGRSSEEKGFVEFLNMIIEVLKVSGLISIDGEKDNSKN